MSNVSNALVDGQDRIELVRTEIGRAREVMDRVDAGLEIAEDVLESTEKVIEAGRRLLPVVVVLACVVGIGIGVGLLISRRRKSRQGELES